MDNRLRNDLCQAGVLQPAGFSQGRGSIYMGSHKISIGLRMKVLASKMTSVTHQAGTNSLEVRTFHDMFC